MARGATVGGLQLWEKQPQKWLSSMRRGGLEPPNLLIRSQAERRTARNLEADKTDGKGTKAGERRPKGGGHLGGQER